MSQPLIAITALLGAVAVSMGALGGHAMHDLLSDTQMTTWQTATQYLMWHVLAALAVALSTRAPHGAAWLWLLGGGLFAASLYGWLLVAWRPLVWVTPIGGGVMIAGWLWLMIQAWRGQPAHG